MNKIINAVEGEKIIAIVRGVEASKLLPLAEALYAGGIRLLEITYCADGSVSDEQTAKSINTLSECFKDRMYIGAGTVLTAEQAELTAAAGGSFIISPDTNIEVIRRTKELGLISIPGALTPTEVQLAHSSGADFVKLFPVTSLGPDYIRAIRAPLSGIKLLAVGGINTDNIAEYLRAGISGFGIGSNITPRAAIENERYGEITALAQKYVSAVKL